MEREFVKGPVLLKKCLCSDPKLAQTYAWIDSWFSIISANCEVVLISNFMKQKIAKNLFLNA